MNEWSNGKSEMDECEVGIMSGRRGSKDTEMVSTDARVRPKNEKKEFSLESLCCAVFIDTAGHAPWMDE